MDRESNATPGNAVCYPLVFSGDHVVGKGLVTKLSTPGGTIQTQQAVNPGDYLELRIKLPDQSPPLAIFLAKVRWVEEDSAGLEFILVREEDQNRLRRFIDLQPDHETMEEFACAGEQAA